MATHAAFALDDYLDHQWTDELVGFDIGSIPEGPVAVQDEAGKLLPCQMADGRLFFVVDVLPALGHREYQLVAGQAASTAPVAELHGETVVLRNARTAIKLAGNGTRAAAPVQGIRQGNGDWLGEGRICFSPDLTFTRMESRQLTAGDLWILWEITYHFAGGERYAVQIRLFADQAHVEITESSSLCRDSHWEFSARKGLEPTHSWTHPHQVLASNPQRRRTLDFSKPGNLGAIQMPVYSGIWVPDDYYYFALLNDSQGIAAIGVNGGFWDYPYENQIDIETTAEGDAFFRLSIKAGHRRWLLMPVSTQETINADPFYVSSIHQAAKAYETPLDKVKDYVLAWDDLPAESRPFAIATRDQLAAARERSQSYGPFGDYVAMLDPELPGDHTYYHSGTHRTFSPDCCNDPAVLYVTASTADERLQQARFLKDVVLKGLASRRLAMLDQVGHLGSNSCSINVGRGLRPWAALHDFAAAEGVYTPEEERLVRATFAFYCYKINDPDYWPADHLTLRDDHPRSAHRTHWFPKRQHDWSFYNIDNIPHNFHGDLWSAAGCVALTFPTHPESRGWVERTLEFWECELTEWIFPEGAWLESSTYTLNSMKDYLIYCRMLANAKIRDYFTDERLQRAFRCVAEQLGPHDPRIGGTSLPVMGDGSYPNGFCYVLGWMGGLAAHDESFAAMMNEAWYTTGEYLTEPGRFGLNFCDFLFINPHGPRTPLPVLSSKWYHGLGAILRHAHRTPEEIYLFIKGGIIYSHFHEPEGTFQLWWESTPICDEYGIQYGTGVNGVSNGVPSCHNCIAIEGDDMCYNKGDITTFITTDAFDYVVVEAPIQRAYLGEGQFLWGFKGEVSPAGWLRRHFFFVKPGYIYVYDELESPLPTTYHLNTKADAYQQDGNCIHYDGRYGIDLEFLAIDLGNRELVHGEFDLVPSKNSAFKPPKDFYRQLQLSIAGKPHQDYATLLVPHRREVSVQVASDPGTGGACITKPGSSERTFVYPRRRQVQDGPLCYVGQAGSIRQEGASLILTQAKGTTIGLTDQLVIDGDGPFTATFTGGKLTIKSTGIARWLHFSGAAWHGPTEIYIPAGDQALTL